MAAIVAEESTMPMSPVTATVKACAGGGSATAAGGVRKATGADTPYRASPTE
jgi:hypothetical protein